MTADPNDPTTLGRLDQIADSLETRAEIDPGAARQDNTVPALLQRINDAIKGGAFEAHLIEDHTDTTISNPNDGDFFRFSAPINAWIATTMDLSDATDVSASPINGQYLRGDGSVWSNSVILLTDLPTINLSDLGDTTIAIPGVSDFLRHDGTDWKNVGIALGDLPAIGLDDLNDVTISAVASRHYIRYNTGTGQFENGWITLGAGDFTNVAFVGGTADSLAITDGAGLSNTIGYGAADLLLRNGSRALTADWDAGAFDIEAQGLRATNIIPDVTDTTGIFTYNVANTVSIAGAVHTGLDINIDYDFNNGAGFDTNKVLGLNIDLNISSTAVSVSLITPQSIKSIITNDANTRFGTAVGDNPYFFKIDNQKTDQSFAEGAFHVLLDAGTDSAQLVASKFVTTFGGTGNAFAYQGYIEAAGGATGKMTVIEAFALSKAGITSLIGVSSKPRALGTPPAVDLVCSFRGESSHLLLSTASLIVTSTPRALPTNVPTTHLTLTNLEGAGYFEGQLEVDGTIYADGDLTMAAAKMLTIGVYNDGTRGAAGTAGRMIFNTTDGQLNIDDGTNWTLPDGSTT